MFQGWDAASQPIGAQVAGIHHPGSDDWGFFKRISFGQINVTSRVLELPTMSMPPSPIQWDKATWSRCSSGYCHLQEP